MPGVVRGRAIVVDTAGPVASVASFSHSDAPAQVDSLRVVAGADGWLTPAIRRALAGLGSIDRVGVVVGPGAFTGLRVGIAQALGVAFAREVPVVPLSSLALRAATLPGQARVLALLDAKKGRLYAQGFSTLGALPEPLFDAVDCTPDELEQVVGHERWMGTGEGLEAAGEALARLRITSTLLRDGAAAAAAGASVWRLPAFPAGDIAPVYLREPDAKPLGGQNGS